MKKIKISENTNGIMEALYKSSFITSMISGLLYPFVGVQGLYGFFILSLSGIILKTLNIMFTEVREK